MRPPGAGRVVVLDGRPTTVPHLPPKYTQFLHARGRIYREISNMGGLSTHPNVLRLDSVLEMIHDSKVPLFGSPRTVFQFFSKTSTPRLL